jgi:hypothetical protein
MLKALEIIPITSNLESTLTLMTLSLQTKKVRWYTIHNLPQSKGISLPTLKGWNFWRKIHTFILRAITPLEPPVSFSPPQVSSPTPFPLTTSNLMRTCHSDHHRKPSLTSKAIVTNLIHKGVTQHSNCSKMMITKTHCLSIADRAKIKIWRRITSLQSSSKALSAAKKSTWGNSGGLTQHLQILNWGHKL